jgi:hypothetical protein
MRIAAIEPPVEIEIESQCETPKLEISSRRDFSEDESEYFWRISDITLDIPLLERSNAESGNGPAYLAMVIEPEKTFVVKPVASELGSARSLPLDDQIVNSLLPEAWPMEDETSIPVSCAIPFVDADPQYQPRPIDVKP